MSDEVPDVVRALVETWRKRQREADRGRGNYLSARWDTLANELEAALRAAPPVRTYEEGVRDALAKVTHVQREAQAGDPAAPWLECVAALVGALLSAAPPVEPREPSVERVMLERMQLSLEQLVDHLAGDPATQWVAQDIGAILDGTEEDHPHDEQAAEPREPSVPVSKLREVVRWLRRGVGADDVALGLEQFCDAADRDTERETSDG